MHVKDIILETPIFHKLKFFIILEMHAFSTIVVVATIFKISLPGWSPIVCGVLNVSRKCMNQNDKWKKYFNLFLSWKIYTLETKPTWALTQAHPLEH